MQAVRQTSLFSIRPWRYSAAVKEQVREMQSEAQAVTTYLKRESAGGKTVRQIIFAGERFDAMSVPNRRKKVLSGG